MLTYYKTMVSNVKQKPYKETQGSPDLDDIQEIDEDEESDNYKEDLINVINTQIDIENHKELS